VTSTVLARQATSRPAEFPAPSRTAPRVLVVTGRRLGLSLACALQIALAWRPGPNISVFEDEGLYVYMGHRMIDHLLHGAFLQEFPGSYFSGAPGIYPPIAAAFDELGGLQAARSLSLLCAVVATIAVHGLTRRLFGGVAAMLAAFVYALAPGVIFQSHLATYDAMMMMLVALASWLAVYSAQENDLLWAPVIGLLLALAMLTKYAGAVYAPFVAALAVVVAWPHLRWLAVRRAVFIGASALGVAFFILELWGRDLIDGIRHTTLDRDVLQPATSGQLLRQVAPYIGPILGLAVVGALLRVRRQGALCGVLLAAAVVGTLQQIHVGEAISLQKHTAFGMVFAAPLAGDLLAGVLRRLPQVTSLAVTAVLVCLAVLGVRHADRLATGWVDERPLTPVLAALTRAQPGKPILGEQPSPQRYALRRVVGPRQWADTYAFRFNGKTGTAAYADAIRLHYFGTVYLSSRTDNGAFLLRLMTSPDRDRYYNIKAKVPRYLRGQKIGEWLVFAPRSVEVASSPGASR
jgi:4-amino-4-deoxy-L-arabinose transferase-like glycosyltransferase